MRHRVAANVFLDLLPRRKQSSRFIILISLTSSITSLAVKDCRIASGFFLSLETECLVTPQISIWSVSHSEIERPPVGFSGFFFSSQL
jgi:hypothetical protein